MTYSRLAMVLSALALFLSGVAIGQGTKPSALEGYDRIGSASLMDIITLRINQDIIRDSLPIEDGVGIAKVYYEPKLKKLHVWAPVYKELDKKPLDEVRSLLLSRAHNALGSALGQIEGLSSADFEMTFHRFDTQSEKHWSVFAEFRDFKLVLK